MDMGEVGVIQYNLDHTHLINDIFLKTIRTLHNNRDLDSYEI